MRYFYIEPEVAGGLGKNTVLDPRMHPPIVSKLHYQFDGWLGDILVESFPSWIITESGQQKIRASGLTGATFSDVEVTTSEQFMQLYPTFELPKFVWLRVEGAPGQDDFGIAQDHRLVVSERSLEVSRGLGVNHALVTDFV